MIVKARHPSSRVAPNANQGIRGSFLLSFCLLVICQHFSWRIAVSLSSFFHFIFPFRLLSPSFLCRSFACHCFPLLSFPFRARFVTARSSSSFSPSLSSLCSSSSSSFSSSASSSSPSISSSSPVATSSSSSSSSSTTTTSTSSFSVPPRSPRLSVSSPAGRPHGLPVPDPQLMMATLIQLLLHDDAGSRAPWTV